MKKILVLIPQNIIPAIDGGKQSIFYPMQILAKHYNVKAIVFVDKKEQNEKKDYEKINVTPFFLHTDKSNSIIKIIA